ncbi:hypothetical protein IG193_06035 [Infirmifilum lucidum]|uniref:peptidylprolyl isomerase n=1 Tax=Infirmifilum lucidum TaxID=2776706 RepID=A0A7L9FHD6_9CREN|nr:peptidylprolyl isomerase [Infirmifilum lucidum]QOJ78324.1 hypothetical protein IG193_06035 [Infirmifilum lucidum]
MSSEDKRFVLVNYTISILDESGEKIIETTFENVAKEHNLQTQGVFEPELVIIGEGLLFKPVEEALRELKEGESKEVILEPSQAFGERDPKNIRVIPAREFTRQGVVPRVGEEIEVGGQRGRIIRVGGGRVTVDFNHPFAGKKVKTFLKLEKVIVSDEEKIKELFHRWFRGIPREQISAEVKDGEATISVPAVALLHENSYHLINAFIRDVEKYLPRITSINLVFGFRIERSQARESTQTGAQPSSQETSASQEAKAEGEGGQ